MRTVSNTTRSTVLRYLNHGVSMICAYYIALTTSPTINPQSLHRNAYLVAAWRAKGKDKKDAANFAYTTLLPDYIPQSINI